MNTIARTLVVPASSDITWDMDRGMLDDPPAECTIRIPARSQLIIIAEAKTAATVARPATWTMP
ncbi:hypothetical protein llg_34430 [Luteolibacter sp. LG18]|nr:hypothetical protein llg_34430 [Luteolibacter sp. LG18]